MSAQEDKMNFWKLHGLRLWTLIGAGIVFLAIMKICGIISIGVATIAITACIVFVCHGLVNRFEEKGLPRAAGAAITFLIGFLIIALIIVLVVPSLVTQTTALISAIPGYANDITDLARQYIKSDNAIISPSQASDLIDKGQDWAISNAGTMVTGITGGVMGLTATLGSGALVLFISIIAALWILIDLPKISVEFRNLFNENQQETLDIIATSFGSALYGWAKSTFVCAVINGVLVGIVYGIVGVPYPSLLAVLTGILYIVPYVGPTIVYVVCTIIGLTVSPVMGVTALLINVVIHESILNILSPKLMSATVNVHPAVTLVAILIGEALMGVVGMLLAVPVVAAIQTIFVTYFEARTGKSLYTEDGALFQKKTERPGAKVVHNAAEAMHNLGNKDE